ncbi:DUF4233 domain-containing protein [Diaminobutyricibacter sp. McL0608]|uniref:DUF4233 domain-containing protein n=1 Tax=Leifsonia sp. McL0608 TaxID=3143537 RepID=UPI0031F327AF
MSGASETPGEAGTPGVPGEPGAGLPARRARRTRTMRESLGSIVLGFELIIVFLGALVLFGLHSLPAPVALGGGAALVVLMIVAVALLRYPVGIILGWAVQLIVIAAGLLVPAFFIVGAIFTAMWTYCMIVGGRIDRRDRLARESAEFANPQNDIGTDNESHRGTEKPE